MYLGDSLSSLQKAVEQKEMSRQQLREQLDAVEKETRAKLLEIDAFNTQLKVKRQMTNNTMQDRKATNILGRVFPVYVLASPKETT